MTYLKLQDATSLMFSDSHTRVETLAHYLGWQKDMLTMRGIARAWDADVRIRARVNHGRWLADCQHCGSGMFTHPEWRIACCAQCGAVYRGVIFPENLGEITDLLLRRPRVDTQNWEPGESAKKLSVENFLHGIRS